MSGAKSKETHKIIDETRRSVFDAILALGSMAGDKEYHEFAKIVCPSLSEGDISEIARHMDRFDDWPESYLLDSIIDYLNLTDEQFMFFLEQYVNPNIHHWRWNEEEERREHIHNAELVEVINRYIDHDGYKLVVKDTIGDKDFYECISTRVGVQGQVKNIIFAAKYKPEIAFDDALNNDIRITRYENHCLKYNRSIPSSGVMWNDLVEWYAAENNLTDDQNPEVAFITRLCD